jgi:glycine/D-amino acid oxidase-like deaminating enzyme
MRRANGRRPSVSPQLPSWWLDEALSADAGAPLAAPLRGEATADVAVVGGGYTGLWTALELRRRETSLRVTVLEADVVAHAPCGRNGGFLHGYWANLAHLADTLGADAALEVARASDAIIPAVRDLAAATGADVWLREGGLLRVSTHPSQDGAIARAVGVARDLGAPDEAVPLSAAEVAAHCRSPRFRGGVRFRDGATVQPARLARALRRAVLDAGAQLHERSRVRRLEGSGPCRLVTAEGTLRAQRVVLAGGSALAGVAAVAPHVTLFGSYVVLTEPVPELLERIGWTGGEAITDARMFLHYFRTTRDGRVVMGSGSGPLGRGARIDARFSRDGSTARRAELGLRRLLPGLDGARVVRSWGGPIDVSADRLPLVGTVPGSRVHYALGYSGHGVGPSWLAGQVLASLVLGSRDRWTALPLVGRRVPSLPPEPLRWAGGSAVRAAILADEEAHERGRAAPLPVRAVAALPRLLGMPIGTR